MTRFSSPDTSPLILIEAPINALLRDDGWDDWDDCGGSDTDVSGLDSKAGESSDLLFRCFSNI
ncbi:MAG: hypothetical protein KUG71_12850, partial [Porticoccaceae bacterium]|nr:hypothetical protein [Porticoccaceae bacterium]